MTNTSDQILEFDYRDPLQREQLEESDTDIF